MKKEEVKKGITKFATGIPVFNHHAAGIDIGDTILCVAAKELFLERLRQNTTSSVT